MHFGLAVSDLGVVAARHHNHDVRLNPRDLLPGSLLGALPGEAQGVLAAGVFDQLGDPVAGGERRVEPLERDDPRPTGAADRDAHAIDPGGGVFDERDGGLAAVGGGRQRTRIA